GNKAPPNWSQPCELFVRTQLVYGLSWMIQPVRFIVHKSEPPPLRAQWSGWFLLAVTVLAPVLAGSTPLWAHAAIMLLCSLLFICAPPRRSVGLLPTALFFAVGVAALIAFLPASLFPLSDWRKAFAGFGVQLPKTLSPQPWLTTEACCLLWLGLAWAY